MIPDDSLRMSLVELMRATSSAGIRVFLGGGYGLYLKQVQLASAGERTFLGREAWPRPRGTPDLDIFLPTEMVVDLSHMVRFRELLDELGYRPVASAKFLHFQKNVPHGHVRVELLTGPITTSLLDKVRVKPPRVRPKGSVELHAYLTQEAVALDVDPVSISLEDGLSVLIPNAFSFLLMKLHACHDRLDDNDKQLGRHHALDVYRVIAMLTSAELILVRRLRGEHRNEPAVERATELVAEDFSALTSRGVVRMREHELAHDDLQVERAIDLLKELFFEGPNA